MQYYTVLQICKIKILGGKYIMKENMTTAQHSILIGNGLFTDKPYHLLIDKNGVKVDKIMSKEEYKLIMDVIKALVL